MITKKPREMLRCAQHDSPSIVMLSAAKHLTLLFNLSPRALQQQ
jgi:hypothetical protein